ncbi:hypothetical protein WJX72_009515 [[Myrmecia] bisecta]|uniref:Uncharacterized protein n=1 Tax=[Myrmecia] bisecta TaxID=41462 RepID=A0AAW1PLQ7_9CHLO
MLQRSRVPTLTAPVSVRFTMASQLVIASTASTTGLRAFKPAPAGPLHKQFAAPSRRTQRLAFNPAFDAFTTPESRQQAQFVRPDCPPDSTEERVHKGSKKTAAAESYDSGFQSKPKFRSALEQVSWMTNVKLRAEEDKELASKDQPHFKLGVFGF